METREGFSEEVFELAAQWLLLRYCGWQSKRLHSFIYSFIQQMLIVSEGLGQTAMNTRPFHFSRSSMAW